MPPLVYSINATLDGCVDHQAAVPDQETHRYATAAVARADALLFGRVTYQMMEEAWRAPAETGVAAEWMEPYMMDFATTIHAKTKYVVSDTLERVDWNAELVRGDDLERTVRALRNEPGDGLLTGGVTLPLALVRLGLIDEIEVIVHPRVAGRGPRLLDGVAEPVDLDFVGRRDFGSGAVALRYAPRGT